MIHTIRPKRSNYYKMRAQKKTTPDARSLLMFLLIGVVVYGYVKGFKQNPQQLAQVEPVIREIKADTSVASPTPTPEPTVEDEYFDLKVKETAELKRYIREIFQEDADVAIAVSLAESGVWIKDKEKKRKAYVYKTDATNDKTAIEKSIGIFQINIENNVRKVHWARIPGSTLVEKYEWLKNPYNATLLAYWIQKESGWYPWSMYTNGRYKLFL